MMRGFTAFKRVEQGGWGIGERAEKTLAGMTAACCPSSGPSRQAK
jgi:hypothetical protein